MLAEELEHKLLEELKSGDPKIITESFGQYLDGEMSLGKLAQNLNMEKSSLRKLLSRNGFSIINYPADEVQAEIDFLLQRSA